MTVPRPAATVILVRDGAVGIEVLLLKRRAESGFVPGAHVFPGGGVDPTDHLDTVTARCDGPDDAVATKLSELASGGLAHRVAAVRETFEEAGVLLAHGPDGVGVGAGLAADLQADRHRLDHGEIGLADLAESAGIRLATAGLRPFAHWITPVGAPRRYDTRFFVTEAPPGQVATPCGREVVQAQWLAPTEALTRFGDGDLPLILPTERCLWALSGFGSTQSLLGAADRALGGPRGLRWVDDRGGRLLALDGMAAGSADRSGRVGPQAPLPTTGSDLGPGGPPVVGAAR